MQMGESKSGVEFKQLLIKQIEIVSTCQPHDFKLMGKGADYIQGLLPDRSCRTEDYQLLYCVFHEQNVFIMLHQINLQGY